MLECAQGNPPNRDSGIKAMFIAATSGFVPIIRSGNYSLEFTNFLESCLQSEPSAREQASELSKHSFIELSNKTTQPAMAGEFSTIFNRKISRLSKKWALIMPTVLSSTQLTSENLSDKPLFTQKVPRSAIKSRIVVRFPAVQVATEKHTEQGQLKSFADANSEIGNVNSTNAASSASNATPNTTPKSSPKKRSAALSVSPTKRRRIDY